MKNKNLIIVIIILVIVLIGIGAYIFLNKKAPIVDTIAQIPPEEVVSAMKPEDIGLSLSATAGNREVIMDVSKTDSISGLDYELSYIAKGDIPRGVIGHIDIKKAGQEVSQKITLGTCSDVCHYDEGVSDVRLILKVTKTDGTTAQIEQALELEE